MAAAYTRDEASRRVLDDPSVLGRIVGREWASRGLDRKSWTFSLRPDMAEVQSDGSLSITNPPAVKAMVHELAGELAGVITTALFETIWPEDDQDAPSSSGSVEAENHRLRLENQQLRGELAKNQGMRQRLVQIDFRTERIAEFFDFDPFADEDGQGQPSDAD